eukprot:802726-Rhodomonas_salina.1
MVTGHRSRVIGHGHGHGHGHRYEERSRGEVTGGGHEDRSRGEVTVTVTVTGHRPRRRLAWPAATSGGVDPAVTGARIGRTHYAVPRHGQITVWSRSGHSQGHEQVTVTVTVTVRVRSRFRHVQVTWDLVGGSEVDGDRDRDLVPA